MNTQRNERVKFFRIYLIAVMIFASITALTASIFLADESAKKITFGEKTAVVVISSREAPATENEIDVSHLLEKIKEEIKKAAGIAPPPISNLYWIAVTSENQRY